MPRQFEVFAPSDGPMVVIIQSDILDAMPTRVAVPLLTEQDIGNSFRTLTPEISVGGDSFLLLPQLTATFSVPELGRFVCDVSDQRDQIIRAIDTLLSGI